MGPQRKLNTLFLLVIIIGGLNSFTKENISIPQNGGELIKYKLIKTFSLADIDTIRTVKLAEFLSTAEIKSSAYINRMSPAKYPVKIYSVTYSSVIPEQNNKPTIATGLIAIPDIPASSVPMISYQHGTVFSKNWAPSMYEKSYEAQFMIAQFASQGYAMIAADYFGIGDVSPEANSYFVRYSTEQACLDIYKASLKVLEKESKSISKFFINGWSQGGYNTMLLLRRLESERIPVKAAFTAAGPVDPVLFVNRGLHNPRPFDAEFMSAAMINMIFSIEKYNNMSGLSRKYINPLYYDKAKALFDFKLDYDAFIKEVPMDLKVVFTQDLFTESKAAVTPFWSILSTYEAYRWLSPTPLKIFGGGRDEAVPDYIAKVTFDYMSILGKKDIEFINAGTTADHRNTYIESLITAKPWIDSFQ